MRYLNNNINILNNSINYIINVKFNCINQIVKIIELTDYLGPSKYLNVIVFYLLFIVGVNGF